MKENQFKDLMIMLDNIKRVLERIEGLLDQIRKKSSE